MNRYKPDYGELPIVGINTFLSQVFNLKSLMEIELSRSSDEEKQAQIDRKNEFISRNPDKNAEALARLRKVAIDG